MSPNKKSNLLENPGRFTKGIIRSNEFVEANAKHENLMAGQRLRLGIKLGAKALSETHESKNRAEGLAYQLISTVNDFADGQAALDLLRKDGASRREKRPHLEKVIEFNHAVKELVNYDPSLRFSELLSFIVNFHTATNKDSVPQIAWFESATKASLDGMRHELAYERIIGEAQLLDDSLEYDEEITIADELNGIDYYILDEHAQVGIDVKSTERARNEAQEKARLHGRDPRRIVWSHLKWEDFEGGFHIPQATAQSKAGIVLQDLYDAKLAA